MQNRNYVLGHSGDTVHRLFLFWGFFLPLGRCFSVDRAIAHAKRQVHVSDSDFGEEDTNEKRK